MSKRKGLVWAGLAAGLAVAVHAGLPGLARHVPWRVERWLAAVASDPALTGVCHGDAQSGGTDALNDVVGRLYPLDAADRAIPIQVSVVRGDTVNAFATLGGRIYVYDGLLQQARSPEELAGVLAHEIEHVRHRHIIQGAVVSAATWGGLRAIFGGASDAGIAHSLLTLSFSREQEAEADEDGLRRLRTAGVDADGLVQFFERAGRSASAPALVSSHPADADRAQRAARFRGYPVKPVLSADRWVALRGLCQPASAG